VILNIMLNRVRLARYSNLRFEDMVMNLTKQAQNLINDPIAFKALATTSSEGRVDLIPVGSMNAPDSDTIVFAAIFENLKETHENLKKAMEKGELVSVLVAKPTEKGMTSGFQAKCKVINFDTSILGPFYLGMRTSAKKMGFETSEIQGAWVLEPEEVIDQPLEPRVPKTT